jgi:DNA-directed RNA polymerase specialized sigma24 family protein
MQFEAREDMAVLRGQLMASAAPWANCRADAEDLVQGALMRALEQGRGLGGDNVRGWLTTILRNLAIDTWRKESRKVPLSEYIEDRITVPVVEPPVAWASL